jgi:hypothetical protein
MHQINKLAVISFVWSEWPHKNSITHELLSHSLARAVVPCSPAGHIFTTHWLSLHSPPPSALWFIALRKISLTVFSPVQLLLVFGFFVFVKTLANP